MQLQVVENKDLLTAQPLPLSEESLSRQQAFAASCAMALACDLLLCGTNWILQIRAALFCHKPWALQGFLSLLRATQLETLACAFTTVSL